MSGMSMSPYLQSSNNQSMLNSSTMGQGLPSEFCPRKTKIICTLGPSCSNESSIVQMLDAGMNVARINLCHGDFYSHITQLKLLRTACLQRPLLPVTAMLDTRGPSIRTGQLKQHKPLKLNRGATITLTTHDYDTL